MHERVGVYRRLVIAYVLMIIALQSLLFVTSTETARADFNQFNKSLTGSMSGAESFDMSANGQYQIGVVDGKDVYISSNYGASFQFSGIGSDWLTEVAMSSDGSKMVAAMQYTPVNSVASAGDVYISTDYGVTWTMSNATQHPWSQILISDDGAKLVAIAQENGTQNLYYSTNAAASWTKYAGVSNTYWDDISMTNSGSVIWASTSNSSGNTQGIYVSTNFGVTFTKKSATNLPAGWCSLANDATGSTVYSASNAGLYRSFDTGTTWSKVSTVPPPSNTLSYTSYRMFCVSISSDAKKIFMTGLGEFAYFSIDSGATWTKTTIQEDFLNDPFEPESAGSLISSNGNFLMVAFGNNYYTYAFQTPTTPQNLSVSYVSNTSFQLSWQAPSIVGDAPITNYQIETSTNGTTWKTITRSDTTTTFITLGSLTQGTGYYFRVTASNPWGYGPSLTSRAYVPGPVPRAPTSLTGTPGDGEVTLSWVSVAETSPVRDFSIEYSDNSGSSYSTFSHSESNATSITVAGLTNGTPYLFRVKSINDAGTGTAVVSTSITPRTTPDAPTSLSISATTTTFSLSWSAPSNGGSAITDYEIEYSSTSGSTWDSYADGTSTLASATVSGLLSNTNYIFRVAARNIVGVGTTSASTTALKLVSAGPATISLSLPGNALTASKSTQVIITAQVSDDGKVKILVNNKPIPGCSSLKTNSLTTTCKWKPAIKGSMKLTATLTPNNQSLSAVNANPLNVFVAPRKNQR